MRKPGESEEEFVDRVAKEIVDACLKIHRKLGPGLLESVYERCLFHELTIRKMKVQRQVPVPIEYEGIHLESGLILDLLVEDCVIVEIKAIEKLLPVHDAQLLSYIRLANKTLGLLVNFHIPLIRDGIKRMRL
jgi:GxxExxY protein